MPAATFPARCAVSVVCGETLVSQVYPAAVPVEAFLDNAIELLDEDLKRRGSPGLDSAVRYEFRRTNGTRLDITKSLTELGVDDGATLVLSAEEDGGPFEPQLESLSTGLARVGRRLFPPVTTSTAVGCAIAVLAMSTMTVLVLAWWVRRRSDGEAPGVAALFLGAILSGCAVTVHRWFPDSRRLIDAFAWVAMTALAGGVAMVIPGRLNAAHLFVACLAGAVWSAIVAGLTQRHIELGSATGALSLLGTLVAGTHEWLGLGLQRLGVLGLLACLLLVTVSPNVALWLARIRPPYFGSITGRDIFHRGAGMPADAVTPVDPRGGDEPVVDTTPASAEVTAAALRANGVLTGLCIAVAVGAPAAAWFAVTPGAPHRAGAALLVMMFAAIFICRARAFSDRRQAMALVLGAAAMQCALAARYVLFIPGDSPAPFLWTASGVSLFASAAMAAALLVPGTRFTPIVRTFTEWAELAAIVIAVPLAAWITGLFTWVRMR